MDLPFPLNLSSLTQCISASLYILAIHPTMNLFSSLNLSSLAKFI